MTAQAVLPEFEHPPVVEVALAIEFEQALGFRALDLGRLAAAWEDSLPKADERPRLPRMEPPDDDRADNLLNALFDIEEPVVFPRLWMQNDLGDRVVQIQQDRLVVNWRKEGSGIYPRYEFVRERLQDAWKRLVSVCEDIGNDEPIPSMCEVQYINHIRTEQGWNSPQDTARLIVPWQGMEDNEHLPSDHLCQFSLHCHFPKEREGWLNVDGWTTSVSAENSQVTKMMTLNLTSRGLALSRDFDSALEFLDVAHGWIVQAFTAITTPEAHAIWGRLQ